MNMSPAHLKWNSFIAKSFISPLTPLALLFAVPFICALSFPRPFFHCFMDSCDRMRELDILSLN